MDPENENLDDVLEDDEAGAPDDDSLADGDEGHGADDDQSADNKDKRINDLMSKWQKAEARAKKAEAALKPDAKGAAEQGAPDEANEWLEFAKSQARDAIYGSDPRFAEHGLDRDSITGATPAEMRDSAKRLSGFLDKVQTSITNKVLAEHGLTPVVRSGAPPKQKSFDDMSDEEIEKYLQRATS